MPRVSLLRIPALLGSLMVWKLWLLLLGRLDELTLLGTGLNGGRGSVPVVLPIPFTDRSEESRASWLVVFLIVALDLERLETGSRVTIRAFGAGNGAISILSKRFTRLRHDRTGFIVVGLVRVDVSI